MYGITEEQLESLVSMAQYQDAAAIIVNEVKKSKVTSDNPHALPTKTAEQSISSHAEVLHGLKRIYAWMDYEIKYETYSDIGLYPALHAVEQILIENAVRRYWCEEENE